MSRLLWRCRNRDCPVPHGAVLGRLTTHGGLVLNPNVRRVAVYLDTDRVVVTCPHCATCRAFHGSVVILDLPP